VPTQCVEPPGSGRVDVSSGVDAWTRSADRSVCCGEPRAVPPGSYDVVSELHESAVVEDPDRLAPGHVAERFLVIDVDGEHVVVRRRDVSDAVPDSAETS
jgi:hypothetical protein